MWSSWYEMSVCLSSIRGATRVVILVRIEGPRLDQEMTHAAILVRKRCLRWSCNGWTVTVNVTAGLYVPTVLAIRERSAGK